MPIEAKNILVGFDAYSEPDTSITAKCYRCIQVKDISFSSGHMVSVNILTVMLNTL